MPTWLVGDSIKVNNLLDGLKCDFLFSCPPYADLEVYSDNPLDLSNMEYPDFKKSYFEIINKASLHLKDDRFACFVVGEARDSNGKYYNFISDTIDAFILAGLNYYNEIILVNSIGTAALRATRQFNSGRKVCKTHQNVLVFYKGNIKNIKNNFKPILKEDE